VAKPSIVHYVPPVVPVLIEIGPLTLYTFGAMMAVAFLVGGFVVAVGLERKGYDPEHAWSILFWAAVGGIVGSRLLVIFDDFGAFLDRPIEYLISGSGFIWYGGLVGGAVTVTIYVLRKGIRWLAAVDAVAPGLALGHAIGRIGCQVSGDGDWGTATSLPWAMAYPEAVIGWSAWVQANGLPADVRVHPAPVYETIAYSVIFLVLWTIRDRNPREGTLFWTYLLLSSVARFAVETVRVEPVVALGLTQAQWFAIVIAIVASALLAFSSTRGSAAAR
jgi:phosphatidylglycerol---prolipoprotein diacylglyceryl transferase